MSNARRSERLRRKRQTTPGLSQPGAYTLFGSGYVVESEASFIPPSNINERRSRYQDAPHILAEESSTLQTNAQREQSEHRAKAAQNATTSLFDLLGSAAKRPAMNHWPTFKKSQFTQGEGAGEPDANQPKGGTNREGQTGLVRRLDAEMHHSANRRHPSTLSNSSWRGVFALVTLFFLMMPLILLLQSLLNQGQRGRYFERAGSGQLVDWYGRAESVLKERSGQLWYSMKGRVGVVRRIFTIGNGSLTSAQLDNVKEVAIAEARRVAVEEARKVGYSLMVQGKKGNAGASAPDFGMFRERFAADKGLPADYGLRSAGGCVLAAQPSVVGMYAKWLRSYAEALLSDGKYTPVVPRRPVAVLEAGVLPGECWGFEGEAGSVTIGLARAILVRMVTVEHTPEASVWSVLSAPRRIRVWGSGVGGGEKMLGEMVFEIRFGTGHLQSFEMKEGEVVGVVRAVRFEILSNHGGKYTCVYRLRVHGEEVGEKS